MIAMINGLTYAFAFVVGMAFGSWATWKIIIEHIRGRKGK